MSTFNKEDVDFLLSEGKYYLGLLSRFEKYVSSGKLGKCKTKK